MGSPCAVKPRAAPALVTRLFLLFQSERNVVMNGIQYAGRLRPANVRIASPVAQSVTVTGPVEEPLTQESFVVDRPRGDQGGRCLRSAAGGGSPDGDRGGSGHRGESRWSGMPGRRPRSRSTPPASWSRCAWPTWATTICCTCAFEQPMVCSGAPCDWWIRYRDAATNQFVRTCGEPGSRGRWPRSPGGDRPSGAAGEQGVVRHPRTLALPAYLGSAAHWSR